MKKIVIKIIELYQRTLSPDTGWFSARFSGGYCKYTPHCSEYGRQAVMKYGAGKGLALAFWRVLRCNPWSGGGIDEVK
ncbi:MAG: membrane protein insertion efficiency factor YidD [Patescibacteria group bacterium]